MNYIDAHVHVWTDNLEQYPIAPGFKKGDMKPSVFSPDELLSHANPCGVDRIVLIQMSYYGTDNAYMLKVMQDYEGVFSGIGIVDPQQDRPDDAMRALAQKGVRGFRIAPRQQPVKNWLDGDGYERMLRAGVDENLALCPLIGADGLPALARRCEQFPNSPVIIDHLCRIGAGGSVDDAEVDQLCNMAQYSNIMVKISAFYALGQKIPPYLDLGDLIERICNAFGADRLMWASDCPFQVQDEHTYAASIELIRDRLDFLSDADKEQILRGTAESFFFG